MLLWAKASIIAVAATIILVTILYLLIRCRKKVAVTQQPPTTIGEPQITTSSKPEIETKRRHSSYQLFGRGSSTSTSFFNWADHPTLITDAVENGWSRFAFTNYTPSTSMRSSLFSSLRVPGDHSDNTSNDIEESWEIGLESADFMQKIHFKINGTSSNFSTIRMALPLPGPAVANSFPQEAYFEITVLSCSENIGVAKGKGHGEKAKLLVQQSDSSAVKKLMGRPHFLEELKTGGGRKVGEEELKMSLGLTVGGSMTSKVPGTYPGSIGFNSDGSVYLTGMKLVYESEKEDWAQTGKVIGCGFDPRLRKVFFTVDSKLIHVLHCKSEEFGAPLYPVVAANVDVTILVNSGQSKFIYAPPNAHRTPNPCFIAPLRSSPSTLGYEDSKELFSMGRIDSNWFIDGVTMRSTTNNNSNSYYNNNRTIEYELESEAELFEIALDNK